MRRKTVKVPLDLIEGHCPLDYVDRLKFPMTRRQFDHLRAFRAKYATRSLLEASFEERLEVIGLLVYCRSSLLDEVVSSILYQTMNMDATMITRVYSHTESVITTSLEDNLDFVSAMLVSGKPYTGSLNWFLKHFIRAPPHARARLHALDMNRVAEVLNRDELESFQTMLLMNYHMHPIQEGLEALLALYPSFANDRVVRDTLISAALTWKVLTPAVPAVADNEDPVSLLEKALRANNLVTIYQLSLLTGDIVNTKNATRYVYRSSHWI